MLEYWRASLGEFLSNSSSVRVTISKGSSSEEGGGEAELTKQEVGIKELGKAGQVGKKLQ